MKRKYLLYERPDIASEWDYSANGDILPDKVALQSHKSYHWICPKGHKYELPVAKRTTRGDGCPYCSGKKPIVGKNDFKTLYPEVAAEWDYDLNDSRPEQYLPYSNFKVSWICKQGHPFRCRIIDRTKKGIVCPVCYGRYPICGKTDLATVFPELAQEWSKKNRRLKPTDVTAHSNITVWWHCSVCGHEWRAMVKNRSYGRGCPACNKKRNKKE